VNNLNAAIKGHAELESKSAEDLRKNLSAVPEENSLRIWLAFPFF
jgi:superoxide dismutase